MPSRDRRYIFGTFAFHVLLAWRAVHWAELNLPIDYLLMSVWAGPHVVLVWLASRRFNRTVDDGNDGDSSLTRLLRQPWDRKLADVRRQLKHHSTYATVRGYDELVA